MNRLSMLPEKPSFARLIVSSSSATASVAALPVADARSRACMLASRSLERPDSSAARALAEPESQAPSIGTRPALRKGAAVVSLTETSADSKLFQASRVRAKASLAASAAPQRTSRDETPLASE